ncbi:MAG: phosphoribosyl-AMP cyclohydrolase, partial [Thermodesulfobacteriota bacterium]|nr:phosphoribosyl-AMP cyclohydrolase [Thermodesulfobacteriota bacterium]
MIRLDFEKCGGLIPTVVQEFSTGEVLMLAFMNEKAWEETQRTGKAAYWSRTRQELWVKGKTSGHVQLVKEIRIDCDDDTILLKVEQLGGAACHTGYRSCFFKLVEGES